MSNINMDRVEMIKASLSMEEFEREVLLSSPFIDEVEDSRVKTKLSFFDIEELQYFVSDYSHYSEVNESNLFLNNFILDFGLDQLDRIKYDLERNKNDSLGIVNHNLEEIYKNDTTLIDEIIEKINILVSK